MSNDPPSLRPEGFPGQRLVIVPPAIAVKALREPVTRDLCVTHIGAFSAAGGHFVERPRGTSQHILLACVSGKGHATLGGREWRVEPGDLLFLPPREAHSYGADELSPWTILWAHFRGERAGDYLSMLGVSRNQPLVTVSDTGPLAGAFEDAFHFVTYGFGQAALIGLATGFVRMLGVARVLQRTAGSQPLKTENRLLQTLATLRESLEKPWTVETMAHDAGLSVPHFTEMCRRQTGMPPLAYLIRLRLQRAMDLLQQGQHNVEEVARAVGYEDPFYFSRLFRKHLGIPPSACRQGP
jgi:AraC-like DNA-binding protein